MEKYYFVLQNSDSDLVAIIEVHEETDNNIIDKTLLAIEKKCNEKVYFVQKYIKNDLIKIEVLFTFEEREFNHTETFSLTPLDIF